MGHYEQKMNDEYEHGNNTLWILKWNKSYSW